MLCKRQVGWNWELTVCISAGTSIVLDTDRVSQRSHLCALTWIVSDGAGGTKNFGTIAGALERGYQSVFREVMDGKEGLLHRRG